MKAGDSIEPAQGGDEQLGVWCTEGGDGGSGKTRGSGSTRTSSGYM